MSSDDGRVLVMPIEEVVVDPNASMRGRVNGPPVSASLCRIPCNFSFSWPSRWPRRSWLAHAAVRIGQPAVFGEILAGLVLGPTVLNVLDWPLFAAAIHEGARPLTAPLIRDLAELGVVLLMFVAGLETDLVEMRRVGNVAFWAAFGGVVVPLVGGALTAAAFGLPLLWEGIFIGTILTATSVSISAQTLMELGALRSREGATILGAAVIDDVMGILVLSLVVAFARSSSGGSLSDLALIVLRIAAYFTAAILAGRWLGAMLRWAENLGVSQSVLAATLVIVFVYSWAADTSAPSPR